MQRHFTKALFILPLMCAQPSFADQADRDNYADIVSKMSNEDVWNVLTSSGFNKCRIAKGVKSSMFCQYYFKTNIGGGPVFNTDNSTASYYAGSATASRMVKSGSTRNSTGCLPIGGVWGSTGWTQWGGNNSSEATSDMKQYTHDMIVKLIKDTADPCDLDTEITAAETALPVGSITLTDVYFAPLTNNTSLPDRKKCYVKNNKQTQIDITFASGTIPAGTGFFTAINSATACETLFNQLAFEGKANLLKGTDKATPSITAVNLVSTTQLKLSNEASKKNPVLLEKLAEPVDSDIRTELSALAVEKALVADTRLNISQKVTAYDAFGGNPLSEDQMKGLLSAVSTSLDEIHIKTAIETTPLTSTVADITARITTITNSTDLESMRTPAAN